MIDAGVLFRQHGPFVARFLGRIGAPPHELADLVQEVFVIVHRKGFVQGAVRPTVWLAEIARRVFANRTRWFRSRPSIDGDGDIDEIAASHQGADDVVEARAGVDRVRAALMKLSVDRRVVFVLHEVEGESCESIATGLGIPTGTVYSRLYKARREFQRAYERLRTKGPAMPPEGVLFMNDPPPLVRSPATDARLRRDLGAFIACPLAFDIGVAVDRFEATQGATTGMVAAEITTTAKVVAGSVLAAVSLSAWLAGASADTPASAPRRAPDIDDAIEDAIEDEIDAPAIAARVELPQSRADERPVVAATKIRGAAVVADPPPRRTSKPTKEHVAAASAPEPAPKPAPRDQLTAEMAATQRARSLLARDPSRALSVARAAEQAFAGGIFSEERQAIIVLAVAALGRSAESTTLARDFLGRFPESPHARKIREMLGEELP